MMPWRNTSLKATNMVLRLEKGGKTTVTIVLPQYKNYSEL